MSGEVIAIIAIVLIVGLAVLYIIKAKKSGRKCIGCPDSATCSARSKNNEESNCCCGNCKGGNYNNAETYENSGCSRCNRNK